MKTFVRQRAGTAQLFLQPADQLTAAFGEASQALMNNQRIAAECAVELPLHQRLLPHYPLPAEESAADYLRKICFERLPQRVDHVTSAYEQRLDYELSVIHKMGFDDYLIIWDVMDFAHQQEIVTGAGRDRLPEHWWRMFINHRRIPSNMIFCLNDS